MKKDVDLKYTINGRFTRFVPVSEAGINFCRKMWEQEGSDCVWSYTLPAVLRQIRAAGYTVIRSPSPRTVNWTSADDALLAELQE